MSMDVDASDGQAAAPALQGPLVFQCIKCMQIIGDSYAMLSASQDLEAIILTGAVNCREGEDLRTAKNGYDMGCTYLDVLCEGCEATLGRVYKTTSRKLDYTRDLFTLFTQNLKSYTLGSSGIAVAPDDEPKTPIADSATPVEPPATSPPSVSTEAVMETLTAEKLKLQQAIDEQKKMIEEQAEALRVQSQMFSKFRDDNGARLEKRDAHVTAEFDALKSKIAEIDDSMAKVKALWVHFDQRVKMLETFSSGLLSQLGVDGQETTSSGMDVDMVANISDSTGGNVSDGSSGKRSKRKR